MSPPSLWPSWHHYLAVITLLDQLDLKEYNWRQLQVILQDSPVQFILDMHGLFGGMKTNIELSRLVSNFLMDRKRARSFWVNSQKYADLARHILEFMHVKWVYNPYTFICANMNAWIHSRCFIDIFDIHNLIPQTEGMSYYEVGKLAFVLLPILLSRIEVLGLRGKVHEFTAFLQSQPPFCLIKNDPLKLEKTKATQAIQEFLKVWF